MRRHRFLLVLALGLSACAADPAPPEATAQPTEANPAPIADPSQGDAQAKHTSDSELGGKQATGQFMAGTRGITLRSFCEEAVQLRTTSPGGRSQDIQIPFPGYQMYQLETGSEVALIDEDGDEMASVETQADTEEIVVARDCQNLSAKAITQNPGFEPAE